MTQIAIEYFVSEMSTIGEMRDLLPTVAPNTHPEGTTSISTSPLFPSYIHVERHVTSETDGNEP